MADKNFKSKAAYLKWIKYGHASGEFKETPGNQSISIRNKNKKVEHTKYLNGGQLQIPPPDEGDVPKTKVKYKRLVDNAEGELDISSEDLKYLKQYNDVVKTIQEKHPEIFQTTTNPNYKEINKISQTAGVASGNVKADYIVNTSLNDIKDESKLKELSPYLYDAGLITLKDQKDLLDNMYRITKDKDIISPDYRAGVRHLVNFNYENTTPEVTTTTAIIPGDKIENLSPEEIAYRKLYSDNPVGSYDKKTTVADLSTPQGRIQAMKMKTVKVAQERKNMDQRNANQTVNVDYTGGHYTNTQGNVQTKTEQKAYGGYINKIDAPEIGGYFRLKNQMAEGGDIKYGSKEYNKAYREGTIARQVGDEYIMNLPDAEAMAEKYAVTAVDPRSIDPMTGERYPMWDQLPNQYKQVIVGNDPMAINARNVARQGHTSANDYLADVRDQIVTTGAEATSIPAIYRLLTGEADYTDPMTYLELLPGIGVANKTIKNIKQLKNLKKLKNSEIDWSKWNKEIPNNKPLMKEYAKIEKTSKANGTWMKNPDGSDFEGLPEQFVQQNSENFKKAFPKGIDKTYRGTQAFNPELTTLRGNNNDPIIFGTSNKSVAENYATHTGYNLEDEFQKAGKRVEFYHPDKSKIGTYTGEAKDVNPGLFEIGVGKDLEKIVSKGNKEKWFNVENKEVSDWLKRNNPTERELDVSWNKELLPDRVKTDDIAAYLQKKNLPIGVVKDVNDGADFFGNKVFADVTMINPKKASVKSLMYNNGMFDMSNPNIYKALVPAVGGTAVATAATQEKAFGGYIDAPELNGYFKLKQ